MRPLLPPMRRYGTDRPARLPYVNLLVISALLLYFLWRVCMPNDMPRRTVIRRASSQRSAWGASPDALDEDTSHVASTRPRRHLEDDDIALPEEETASEQMRRNESAHRRAQHNHSAAGEVLPAARWWLPDEEKKSGVGVFFFAYGGTKQIHMFLNEASAAALSIRVANPTLNIAICSNNETVDSGIFTHHIKPRADLLFPGSACSDSCRPDKLPRQWTTRVYYLALTPFEITWVLDSNVYQCPGPWAANAVHNFLLAAQRTALWDYDIAHANQDDGTVMFPHCFSMIWRWNRRSSNVVRDWFMLMLRRGITTSDQEPLRLAESRQAHTADGLRVGQVPTEFSAAMYSTARDGSAFWPRISRRLQGVAQIVHATPLAPRSRFAAKGTSWKYRGMNGPTFCRAFNADVGQERQMVQFKHRGALSAVLNDSACRAVLQVDDCPYATGGMRDLTSDGEILPTKLMGVYQLTSKLAY